MTSQITVMTIIAHPPTQLLWCRETFPPAGMASNVKGVSYRLCK